MARAVTRVAVLVLAAVLAPAPAAAQADAAGNTALGIPCVPGPNAVRICSATLANRVPTFDGVPLDVEVTLPPPSFKAPYPLIVGLHGFGTAKQAGLDSGQATRFAARGYATLVYSARGIALSCGTAPSRTPGGCEKGWIHLADSRYEVRDSQHLAGLLLDEGLVRPRIGATGTSYGGGQSLMLATLRDKMVLPSGKVVPWTSPKGVPMEVAAAAPKIGWSDLSQALTPTGHTLDFRAQNPYGPRFGVVNQSYLGVLFFAEAPGFYAPAGKDPEADIYNWKAAFDRGEPYGDVAAAARDQLTKYHSAYYLQDLMSPAQRTVPAPVVIYNGFNDDIMPPAEALRFYNLMRDRYPGKARIGLVFGKDFAHPRGSLAGTPAVANRQRDILFDHYLLGDAAAEPLEGVITEPQSCPGAGRPLPHRRLALSAPRPGVADQRSAEAVHLGGWQHGQRERVRSVHRRHVPERAGGAGPGQRELPAAGGHRHRLHADRHADGHRGPQAHGPVRPDQLPSLGRRAGRPAVTGHRRRLPPRRQWPHRLPAPALRLALRGGSRAQARAARPRLALPSALQGRRLQRDRL